MHLREGALVTDNKFLVHEVVLLGDGPGDSYFPEPRGQTGGINALHALGVCGELDLPVQLDGGRPIELDGAGSLSG